MKNNCFNDSLAIGEYFTLDLDEWEEISCSMIDEEWLYIGRKYDHKGVRVFIKSCPEGVFKNIDNFIMFDRKAWSELRRVRGTKKGLPLEICSNGAIWVGKRFNSDCFKVFVKK
jgi:hypothetical protein